MAKDFAGLPVVAAPFSPDVIADEALGFEFVNGTVRITFATVKMIDGAPPSEKSTRYCRRGEITTHVPSTSRKWIR